MAHRVQMANAAALDDILSRAARGADEGIPASPATAPPVPQGKGGSVAGRIAKDIGVGMTEVPRGMVKGIRDAYQNTINIADELGGWIEEAANLPGIKVSSDGIELLSSENLQALRDQGSDLASKLELPDINPPKTVTGGIVKSVAQFLTGMRGASKLLNATSIPKSYARSAVEGMIANFAAFDPHQSRLSNLIEQVPALRNPVTDYLASDEDDSAAEGRFKNAIEGLGLGLLTDGFLKSVKLLRSAAKSRVKLQEAADLAPAELPANALRELGDDAVEAGAPLVSTKPAAKTAGATPAQIAKAAPEKDEIFINFARIDTPDDVKRAISEMANLNAKSIKAAQRGKQSFEQIKLNADQVDAWKALVSRREGDAFNAETAVAARNLWASSADKLTTLAKTAADNPSEGNLFAFRKMLTVHNAIQHEVLAARTETARALASWRIPAGGSAERLRDITGILNENGGTEAARELASRVAGLVDAGMYKELSAVVEKTAYAKTRDAVLEGWINGLLSNPTTHIVNTMSNSQVIGLRMAERAVASKIASALDDQASVAAGEASQQWFGITQGFKDAMRYAAKAAKTGNSGYGIGKLEGAREGAISSEALGISSSGWLGRGVDKVGQIVRIPGRALTAEDEFFKTIGYRMEVNAQALRQATKEVNAGQISKAAMKQRIAELIANPPESIRMSAVDAATYQTFTNTPGKFAQAIGRLTSEYPMLKVILPFTRTPANILRFTFERTPLAPLMSQFRANVAAGGARRDLALAQMGLGTMAMMTGADMAMNGHLSGSGPEDSGTRAAMSRQGWQPYSMKVGDRWFAINRLDPVSSLFTMSADIVDTLRNAQHEALDDADTEKLTVAAVASWAANMTNKTYLSGLASLFEAMADPDQFSEGMIQRLTGSVVPAGVANVTRQMDPYRREVYSMLDAIKARTPGLSKDLPARLNVWGEPISYESGFGTAYDALSPIYTRTSKNEPIDAELIKQEANLTMPRRRTSFNGATVDLGQHPQAYARYVALAGNELKHPAWGVGAKDLLNQIITGQHPLSAVYSMRTDGPDGGKVVMIKDIMRQYQDLARQQVLQEFPEIAEKVGVTQERQRALRYPNIG